MNLCIDVVIPSFRLEERFILPILRLRKPALARVKFYLLLDNPALDIPAGIRGMIDNDTYFLIVNEKNIGAPATRNKGIDLTGGDWILFLDDDISPDSGLLEVYAEAALKSPEETGFIGLVKLPEPQTIFARAVKASGAMDIFDIAARRPVFAWGATANIMVRRSAIGDIRFSPAYPMSGGGEDMDFFLKVRQRNGSRDYATLREAVVTHPWWNEGKADLRRPFRYGVGNSLIGKLNPQYTYYDLLNTPETMLLSLILIVIWGITGSSLLWTGLLFLAGILLIEIIATAIQAIKRYPAHGAKVFGYVLALRFSQEAGVLWGKLSRWELGRIGERFHDDGRISRLYFYRSNTYRTVKWILYPLLLFLLLERRA